jgi:mRNA-degrading endonuclease RelE of RelBE toxin-antitoxin system
MVNGAKPLRGKLAGRYRIRTGDYRVLFHVEGGIVVIEKIGHRSQFYRE